MSLDTSFLNQFAQQDAVGVIDLNFSPNESMSVQYNTNTIDETIKLVPGVVVLWAPTELGKLPIVDVVTVNTDSQCGVVTYNNKINSFSAGDVLTIAHLKGTVIKMVANGAINRGVEVEWVVADQKIQEVVSGKRVGKTLDIASADGDIVRVILDFE